MHSFRNSFTRVMDLDPNGHLRKAILATTAAVVILVLVMIVSLFIPNGYVPYDKSTGPGFYGQMENK